MKKLLIIRPKCQAGSPVYERTACFNEFFKESNFDVDVETSPSNIVELFVLIKKIYKTKTDYLFVTMPPFRNWSLCFLPFVKTVLDIRDGWSIAIKDGYGGLAKPNKIKAFIARCIEKISIRHSYATITCTPGLQRHLNQLSKNKIFLVRNGISRHDYELAKKIIIERNKKLEFVPASDFIKFVCAGKFSEYGKDKVYKIIDVINQRYLDRQCILQLIGCDRHDNKWVCEYVEKEKKSNIIKVEILPRLDKLDLYKLMSEAFCAITVIRDPSYDFGTKIYDYLALELKYLDYFDSDNEFNSFFSAYSDLNNKLNGSEILIVREEILRKSDFIKFIIRG
ncbi:hypothetical protein ACET57_04105 [Aeromonas veronii]